MSTEIFKLDPKVVHVVDISENNMVELVRNIRCTVGYQSGDFRIFAVCFWCAEFEALMVDRGSYDYEVNILKVNARGII